MPSIKRRITTYLTEEEYDRLRSSAARSGLTASTFIKRVCLGCQVNSSVDYEAINALLKANADLGRLGGLFKKAITEGSVATAEIRATLRQIEGAKDQLMRSVEPVLLGLIKKGKKGGGNGK
jgi:hypothetical protein